MPLKKLPGPNLCHVIGCNVGGTLFWGQDLRFQLVLTRKTWPCSQVLGGPSPHGPADPVHPGELHVITLSPVCREGDP